MPISILHRLTIICAQNGVLGGGVEGEDVKILSYDPQKALPCVNTRLLMSRVSKSVQSLSSRSVERFLRTKKEIKTN